MAVAKARPTGRAMGATIAGHQVTPRATRPDVRDDGFKRYSLAPCTACLLGHGHAFSSDITTAVGAGGMWYWVTPRTGLSAVAAEPACAVTGVTRREEALPPALLPTTRGVQLPASPLHRTEAVSGPEQVLRPGYAPWTATLTLVVAVRLVRQFDRVVAQRTGDLIPVSGVFCLDKELRPALGAPELFPRSQLVPPGPRGPGRLPCS